MTDREQFQCLNLLDYLSDLFTASTRESLTPIEILVILNHVKHDPELFAPQVVIAQEEATGEPLP